MILSLLFLYTYAVVLTHPCLAHICGSKEHIVSQNISILLFGSLVWMLKHIVSYYILWGAGCCVAMFAALRYMCGDTYCVAIYVVWRFVLCGDLCYVMIYIVWRFMLRAGIYCVAIYVTWWYILCGDLCYVMIHIVWRFMSRDDTYCVAIYVTWWYILCGDLCYVLVHIVWRFMLRDDTYCSTMHAIWQCLLCCEPYRFAKTCMTVHILFRCIPVYRLQTVCYRNRPTSSVSSLPVLQ